MTERLVATAVGHWEELDGYAVAHGMEPLDQLPLERLCNFVYWRLTEGNDANKIAQIRAKLWQPPVGAVVTDTRSPWSPENETNALGALKSQLGLRQAPTA